MKEKQDKAYCNEALWLQNFYLNEKHVCDTRVNLSLRFTIPIELDPLVWHHWDLMSKKMKITNTGHTLILSLKWHVERPFLTGGPLLGKYVFSQLHFHWGKNNMEGSEHTVDGKRLPLEMHLVYFKNTYLKQDYAMKEPDGIVLVGYFFKLQARANPALAALIKSLPKVQKAHTSVQLECFPLSFLTKEFYNDYFHYWGTVRTSEVTSWTMWLINRKPIGISNSQVEAFRSLSGVHGQAIVQNFCKIRPLTDKPVFHISPSEYRDSTLIKLKDFFS